MGGRTDHRQPTLARLRYLLRLARPLPDVADVFPFGFVRLGESNAQRGPSVPVGPVAAARLAADPGSLRLDADRPLSGLSRDRDRAERHRLLAAIHGAAVLAMRTAVVPVAAAGAQYSG